jgi:endonuclease/exonuclease/phosphatase family metal-dependent hydrolase
MRQIVVSGQRAAVRSAMVLSALLAVAAMPAAAQDIVLQAASAPTRAGQWAVYTDSTAEGGSVLRHPDAGATKLSSALASPTNYFELTFQADAGKPYHLWIHGRADKDSWANDSIFVQFSGSVTSSGSAIYRVGTTSATVVNLEDCSGCGLSGWDFQDNGYGAGVLGDDIYFATTGTQTLRVQTREDGLAIDEIVLSSGSYLKSAPASVLTFTSSTAGTTTATTSTGTLLKVLDWNTHHGVGTDGVYNIDRIATWIVKTGANVVSLNEVEKNDGWGNEDQPARYAALLKAKTGKTWYYKFAQRDGYTNGQGNLLLTTLPLDSSGSSLLSYDRSAARIAITVNGLAINVFSTHLDANSSSYRTTEMGELKKWVGGYAEQRIIAGDFNAWPGATEIGNMTSAYYDSWAVAVSKGIQVSYSGNEAGNTRNSRIDYVFYSHGASRLVLKQCRVFDVRDANGVQPSDHRPVMATFEVK